MAVALNSTLQALCFTVFSENGRRGGLTALAGPAGRVIYSALLGRLLGLCYKLPAQGSPEEYAVMDQPELESRPAREDLPSEAGHPAESPMLYCPVCSERLERRKCKLICASCGYYMSCSDFC
jgi:hypothetical protein